jgi:hypothetical protein
MEVGVLNDSPSDAVVSEHKTFVAVFVPEDEKGEAYEVTLPADHTYTARYPHPTYKQTIRNNLWAELHSC